MRQLKRLVLRPAALGLVLCLLLVGVSFGIYVITSEKHGVAYFANAKNIYPKDRVCILGVDVGEITAITPERGRVKIEFNYNSRYTLPADVKAAVVSPTLVSTRFMQLTPVYNGGPQFPNYGVIPQQRTASPLEFDDLKKEASKLAKSVGPNALDKNGALSRFLDVSARNGHGQGAHFNEAVHAASDAMQTLSEGRQDLFGTVKNLQVFVTGLKVVDQQVVEFNNRLGSVSGTLDENKDEMANAIAAVNRASVQVTDFVNANQGPITTSVGQAGQLTQSIAQIRDNLATALHIGPNTLMNLVNVYNPRSHAITGDVILDNLNTPADLACTFIANSTPGNQADKTGQCGRVLGPTLNTLRMYQPPIGVNPVNTPEAPAQRPGLPEQPNPQPQGPAHSELPPNGLEPGLNGLLMPGGR